MLSVIGVDICFDSVKDIDKFDYHLYRNLPIALNTDNTLAHLVPKAMSLIDKLLDTNHLLQADLHLILLTESASFEQELTVNVASINQCASLNDALNTAESISEQNKAPVLILTINECSFDGVAALLVCEQAIVATLPQLKTCYHYAEIMTNASMELSLSHFNEDLLGDNIEQFLSQNELTTEKIESIVTTQLNENATRTIHQSAWLKAFQLLNVKAIKARSSTDKISEEIAPTTLFTDIDLIKSSSEHFESMLSLISAILCLDQRYRIGSDQELNQEYSQSDWQSAGLYYLPESASYLTTKKSTSSNKRHVIVSSLSVNRQQLFLMSESDNADSSSSNGFLAQQTNKPVIFYGKNSDSLLAVLKAAQTKATNSKPINFTEFSQQQYLSYETLKLNQTTESGVYCVVLIASSFETLVQQCQLAIVGLPSAIKSGQVWKTPAGSYFSGQSIVTNHVEAPVSFIYPGVGALYVGMGKDLLRLFPECYQSLSDISDDLAYSFQDHLMTPRLSAKPDLIVKSKLEKSLRAELANIAEAGVSYACLLTAIFQQQLSLKAISSAGYSMGEVSMFAALKCWKAPQLLGQGLRQSKIFTEQLSGPLKRLQSVWDNQSSDKTKQWESYYLKANLVQVESVLHEFPRVYITIINTPDSLVIAGDPTQCLALAKQLSIRAIALDVPNIIHCNLAKSEYENMKALYALPVNGSVNTKLFSSSCYLPVPVTEKAIAVSISKCLTEQVDFPRLIEAMFIAGNADQNNKQNKSLSHVFIEMGAGKSLSTWIERILSKEPVTCLSVNQKNLDDYSGILKTIAPLISLGHSINLQPFFSGTLIQPVKKVASTVLIS